MVLFECCIHCKPPKRHAGCHAVCEAYKKDKQLSEERNKTIRTSKSNTPYMKPWYRYTSWNKH